MQHVLDDSPLLAVVTGVARLLRAPRPDWAPPHPHPVGAWSIYVGVGDSVLGRDGIARTTWSIVGVSGGDGVWDDGRATSVGFEAAGGGVPVHLLPARSDPQ